MSNENESSHMDWEGGFKLKDHRIDSSPKLIGFYHIDDQYGCFSNWYPAKFNYAGNHFGNVGQFVMYHKAMLFNEEDWAEMIMLTSDPQKCNKIGSLPFKHFDSDLWDEQSRIILKRGVKAKFSQNVMLRNVLLGTGNALLALCSPYDKKWGTGIGIDNPDYRRVDKWTGENLLGTILMEVRDELRHEELLYRDACDSDLIREWAMTAGELEKIPAFSNAVSAYLETIKDQDVRQMVRNDYYLCEVEVAIRTSDKCLAPRYGFFEMKQEVYDKVRKLDLYHEEEPINWLVEDYPEATEDSHLLRSLLAKYYPGDSRKRSNLSLASTGNIPERLVEEILLTQDKRKELATDLIDSYGFSKKYAYETVDIWAEALGIMKDVQELQGVEPEEPVSMGAITLDDECMDEFGFDLALETDRSLAYLQGKKSLPGKKSAFEEESTSTYDESNHPGKDKCDTLRTIREKIAYYNDIEYEPAECHHTGPCSGTCPVCDEEIRYLNEEIKKKIARGEYIYVYNLDLGDLENAGFNTGHEEDFAYMDSTPSGSKSESEDDSYTPSIGSSSPSIGW